MEQWKTDIQTGERIKTISCGNITVVLHRPALTEAVRHRREEAVKATLAPFSKVLNT